MHYLDITDVAQQARTYWAMRSTWPLDLYISRRGDVDFTTWLWTN